LLFKKKFHCFSNNLFVWKCFQTKIVFDTCIEMASNTNNDLRLFQFKTPREYENISQRGEFEFIVLNSTFLRSIYLDFRKRNQRKHNQRKRQKCRLLFNNIPLKWNWKHDLNATRCTSNNKNQIPLFSCCTHA